MGGLLILSSALVPTARAEEVPLPPVPIFMQVAASPDIEEMVRDTQRDYGLSDSFYNTLKCESNFDPAAVGDQGTSFGVAQIHLPAHKEITKEEALDPAFAINWAARMFAQGDATLWSCYTEMQLHTT